jgi:hypothetical protein
MGKSRPRASRSTPSPPMRSVCRFPPDTPESGTACRDDLLWPAAMGAGAEILTSRKQSPLVVPQASARPHVLPPAFQAAWIDRE